MTTQEQEQQPVKKRSPRIRMVLFTIAGILIVYGTITGIHSYITTSQGTVGSAIALVIGALSLLVGLIPLFFPSSSGEPKTVTSPEKTTTPTPESLAYEAFRLEIENKKLGSDFGALIIRSSRGYVGWDIRLTSLNEGEDYFQNVVIAKRLINRQHIYVATFENLSPGTYYVAAYDPVLYYMNASMCRNMVTVLREQVAELELKRGFIRFVLE